MQKIALSRIIREEVTRALVFGLAFVTIVSAWFTGVAYAANGGIFGDILNRILVTPWDSPVNDGTVKNATKLGGKLSTEFVPVKAGQSCGTNKCIIGFQADGTVNCTP
jgi:hypothetical protein